MNRLPILVLLLGLMTIAPTLHAQTPTIVRGRVTDITTGDRAREQIDELARKYMDTPYPPENIKSERVLLRITPERQTFIDQKSGIGD